MATRENMEKKLVLLEQRLKEYGHVPSQKEDRPLYANTKYYYTNYPSHPIVKRLMEKFPHSFSTRRNFSKYSSIKEALTDFENTIKQYGRLPRTELPSFYSKVQYYFNKKADEPGVQRLMRLCAPRCLYNTDEINFVGYFRYWQQKLDMAVSYILDTFLEYKEIPFDETNPILDIESHIDHNIHNSYHYNIRTDVTLLLFYLVTGQNIESEKLNTLLNKIKEKQKNGYMHVLENFIKAEIPSNYTPTPEEKNSVEFWENISLNYLEDIGSYLTKTYINQ